tara:strand:- start:365 stop:2725 length:2361 start_codon:yes stop_codon:yes gene_type:complete
MTARVGIEFVTGKAQAALRQLKGGLDQVKRSVDGLSAVTKRYERIGVKAVQRVRKSFKQFGQTVDNLASRVNGLRGILLGLGGAAAARGILETGISAIEAERKIKLLTQGTNDYEEALAIATRAAAKFGISQTEANSGVARLLARLKPMGLSLNDIETAYNGFNTAATLAGATASESAGAFLQLTQALGSGVLRGQELNSILEQAPLVASAIATEMDVATESLKKLGEEGKISSAIVLAALGRVEKEGADKLTEALKGPAKQFQRFNNAVVDLNRVLSEALLPAIIPVVQKLTQLLRLFTKASPQIKTTVGALTGLALAISVGLPALAVFITSLKTVAIAIAAIGGAAVIAKGALIALPILAVAANLAHFANEAQEAADRQDDLNRALKVGNYMTNQRLLNKELERQFDLQEKLRVAERMGEFGFGNQVGNIKKLNKQIDETRTNINKLIDRMQKLGKPVEEDKPTITIDLSSEEKARLERLRNQSIAAKERFFASQAELAIQKESNDLARIDLQFDLKRAQLQREYVGLIGKALSDEERINLAGALRNKLESLSVERNKAISGHMQDQFDALSKVTAEMLEMAPFTKELSEEFKFLANTINNEIITGIEGMIDGTKTLGQVASSMLKKIASQMLQTAIMGPQGSGGIAGTIFKALGFGSNPLSGFAPKMSGSFSSKPNLFDMDLGLPEFGSIPSGFSFANGGKPPVGKASLVGEKGPELFVPKAAGTIIPNHALGGSANVTVNVDASGSSVEGDADQAGQLGKAIGVAVQQELIKQKRPGGLLAV